MRLNRLWSATEVGIIFVLVMLDIWVFRPYPPLFYGAQVVLLAFVLTGFAIQIRGMKKNLGDYTESLGIGRWEKGVLYHLDWSWAGTLAWSSALALALICLAGHHFKPEFWKANDFWAKKIYLGTLKYIVWGTIQQFFLQGYVASRIYSIFARSSDAGKCERRAAIQTAICAGMLFFFVHTPNPTLMIITPIVGAASVYIFLNCRNIFMIGIAHGILGNAIGVCLANSLRVGPHYWQ